jgi:hypothetical protein
MMQTFYRYILTVLFTFSLLFVGSALFAQEEDEDEQGGYEDLLFKEVEVENPMYYPVVSIGSGMFSYFGEFGNEMTGVGDMPPLKLNVYHYLDTDHNFRINVFGMVGSLFGSMHEIENVEKYNGITNFQTDIIALGLNTEYGFGHFYESRPKLRPFIALGVEMLVFDPKSDISGPNGDYDWSDQIIRRDYNYDFNMRNSNVFELDNFNQNSPAFTLDIGFDFSLSERVAVRVGNAVHYTLTDVIDGIPYKNGDGDVIGNSMNDILNFSYFTIGWDPFSESKTKVEELLVADIGDDFDYTAIADQDRDGILDLHDDCPDNPRGVAIDTTTGCPLDSDEDGIPDYKDEGPNTPKGAMVDENGLELSEDEVVEQLNMDMRAVEHEEAYMVPISAGWRSSKYSDVEGELEIPEKFKSVDKDGDGEISYSELLDAIDDYFNNESDFTANDVYELNDFFFAQ